MKRYAIWALTHGLLLGAVAACSSNEDVPREQACMGCTGALLSGCEQAYDACMDDPQCETVAVQEAFANEACAPAE